MSRRAALLLLGGGAVGSVAATGAFNSLSGRRSVNIGTAADEEALLRVTSGSDGSPAGVGLNDNSVSFSTHDGGTVELLTLGNFLGEDITLTELSVTPDPQDPGATDLSISLNSPPSSLDFQESKTVEATVTCSNVPQGESTGDVSVIVDVTAEGESTSVTLQREITVACRNCVPCGSGEDLLVKYEWVESEEGSSFEIEGSADPNVSHADTTTDSEGEPIEATFDVDYCSVDVVVKAATEYETYEDQSKTITVTDIDGHAISNVRFFCEAPDDVTIGQGTGSGSGQGSGSGSGQGSGGGSGQGSGGGSGQGSGNGNQGSGNGGGTGSQGFDDD